jgi:hypothetical protein
MKRLLLLSGLLACLGLSAALAQNVTQSLSGFEAWVVGNGPAGQGQYTNTLAMRQGRTYALIPSGTTITQVVSPGVGEIVVVGPITTLNLTLPSSPFDQQTVRVSCPGGNVTTLNISAAQPAVASATPSGAQFTSCTAGNGASQSATYLWSTAPALSIWYRIN